MPRKRLRVIGSPCADCSNPITPDVAMYRSPPRENDLMSYCRPCYRERHRKTEAKRRTTGRPAEQQRRHYQRLRQKVIQGYGGRCACCGETEMIFLALDHVNGGGNVERKTLTQDGIYRKVIRENFPPEYRILCHNCNQAMAVLGRCPHAQGA